MYLEMFSPRLGLPFPRESAKASLTQTTSPAGAATATGRANFSSTSWSSAVRTRAAALRVVTALVRYSIPDTVTPRAQSPAAVISIRNTILL